MASSFRFKYEPCDMEEYSQAVPMHMGLLNTKIAIKLAKNKIPNTIEAEFTKMGIEFLEEQLKYPIGDGEREKFNFLLGQLRLVRDKKYNHVDFKRSLEYVEPLVEKSHTKLLEVRNRIYGHYF